MSVPGSPEERLAALGLSLPPVTPPAAAYVPALRTGNYIYVSGQLPIVDGKLRAPARSAPGSARRTPPGWPGCAR